MIWMMWWNRLYGLVRSADNNSDVCGESSQWFAATHSVTPFGLTSRAAITGVVYSISPRPEALRNGYDSLSQPAVTALAVVRGSLRCCVLRTCFAGRYHRGRISRPAIESCDDGPDASPRVRSL